MRYVIKVFGPNGSYQWLSRPEFGAPPTFGSRDSAAEFATEAEAHSAIYRLPDLVRKNTSVYFVERSDEAGPPAQQAAAPVQQRRRASDDALTR